MSHKMLKLFIFKVSVLGYFPLSECWRRIHKYLYILHEIKIPTLIIK